MLKFKKYLSILLAVMMILSSVSVLADGETTSNFSDLDANTIVGKAVSELVPYGIISGYPDGTFKQDNTITRAEFAKIIVTFLNLQNIGTEGLPTGFADVDENSHWGQPYIRTAIDRGIILGYPDGTFKPDNPVKYCEAVKMMVCALNYGDVAASRTQPGQLWYSGYVAQAAELGILKNISVGSAEDPASRGLVAILSSNSLDAEVASTTVGGNGSTEGSGSTAREEFLNTEKVSGVVVGCNQTSIMGAEVKNSSRLITVYDGFDLKTYTVAYGTDTMALLGYKISANVNAAASGEYQEITAIAKDRMNVVYNVPGEFIDNVSANGIDYWENANSVELRTASFANNIEIIYNGKYLGSGAASYLSDFQIDAGNILLISNDGDSAADVAFINDCEIYVVNSSGTDSSTKQKKIYTLYNGGEIIVPEKSNYVKINNKGTVVEDPTSFSVSKYDVINLYKSKDGKVFNMTVTKNKKAGKIDALSGNEITIAGKEYTFAYNYPDEEKAKLKVGNNVSAYLDANGYIACAEAASTAATSNVFMGYLFGAEAGQGVGGVTKIRLYGMSSGKTGDRTYPVASNVKIDGVICGSGAEVEAALQASADIANANKGDGGVTGLQTYSQLIRFTLNVDGEVDTIDTVSVNATPANDDMVQSLAYPKMNADSTAVDSNIWVNTSDNSLKGYKYVSGNKFTNKLGSTEIGVNSSTMVLVVPEDPSDITKYKSTKMSYFSTGNYYRVEGYCMNETKTAQYVVVYANTAAGEISDTADVAMANTVVQAVSSTDASITQDKLTGWNLKSGSAVSDLRSETAGELYDDIQTGEIFRYATDGEYVTDKEMILEIVNKVPVLFGKKLRGTDVDKAANADQAMEWRDVQYDKNKREKTASLSRVIYGTVVAKSEDENGSNRVISITNTLLSDGEGVFNVDAAYDYFNVGSSTKIYVLDTNAAKTEDMITTDVDFNEITTVNANGAADASQVLMFFSGSVKTIIIVR